MIPEREPEIRLPLLRMAAGAQITQSQLREVVTSNTNVGLKEVCYWNENNVEHLLRNNWRASLGEQTVL